MADDGISVYVANLGKYNEGELKGGWITLPVEPDDLDRFLSETVGVGAAGYEEYAIHDWEGDGLVALSGMKIDEHVDLNDLNVAAAILKEQGADVAAMLDHAAEQANASGPLAYASLALQADDIPFSAYDAPEGVLYASLEEKFAYSCAETDEDLKEAIDGKWGPYLNLAAIGRDLAMNMTLTDDGYFDDAQDYPDPDYYSREELYEHAGYLLPGADGEDAAWRMGTASGLDAPTASGPAR
ncbi:antirestriction protein [Bifidobacterium lemurum]|uniref:Antirestriction protein n=1 Tax=Bifidobacterium lemurum TaxID=1603886 RepID=A0A261FL89_9BIFI|nr:antirestriction protein ArdA [Bifidobacterium lemurum]OZG59907.1 antirestriction protein [Bifidobacterium lemurum]QOL33933.1 antirestriction protein ArdA [Bifidobacterium lemurum]